MKALRILLVVVGGMLVVTAVLVGVVFLPAVQTWAVRKAVANQPGLVLEVGRVAAGLSEAQIDDLRVVQNGVVITAKRVAARYSAWDYVGKKRLNVELAAVEGLEVDVRKAAPASAAASASAAPVPAASAAPAFAGILNLAQLPVDLRLAQLSLQGRVLLPDSQSVQLAVQGGGIETGARGRLEWKIDFADARPQAPLSAVRTAGTLSLHIAADRRIDEIELEDTTSVTGPNLPSDQIVVRAKASQAAAGADESYTVRVALRRQQQEEPLLNAQVKYQSAARTLVGAWNIAVRSEQLAALLAGLGLPETAVEGAGEFTLQPDKSAVTAKGEIKARLAKLAQLSPALEAVGAMQVRTAFAAAVADQVATLERLEIDAATAEGKPLVQLATRQKVSVRLQDKRVTLADPAAELAQLAVQSLPLAWAQPLAKPIVIQSGDLSLRLAVGGEADGSRVRLRTVEPVTLNDVTIRDGARTLVEHLRLAVRPQIDYDAAAAKATLQLEGLQITLPAGDAVQGQITADVTQLKAATPTVDVTVQLQEKLVAVLRPYLPLDPGPLAVETKLAGRLQGQDFRLAELHATVKRAGDRLLLAVDALQPIAANFASMRVAASEGGQPALRLRLGEVPLAWGEAFVPKSTFAGGLTGGTVEVLLRSLEDLGLRTTAPITVRGIGARIDGQNLAQDLDLSLDLTAAKRGDTVTFDVPKLHVQQAEATLLRLVVGGQAQLGAKPVVSAKGSFDADLPVVLRQPVLAAYATLARGICNTTFEVTSADAIKAVAQVKVRQLLARQGNQALGDLDVAVEGSFKPEGSGTAKIPLTLTLPNNRRSDLLLDVSFGRSGASLTCNGKLTSNQIFVDDFQALAALAPSSPAPAASSSPTTAASQPASAATSANSRRSGAAAAPRAGPAPAPSAGTGLAAATAERDTEPFWKGATGRFEAELQSVQYGRDYQVKGLRCSAKVSDTQLALENLEGRFNNNPFKVAAGLTFAAAQPKPYTLASTVKVDNFDVGEFLRASSPNEKPQLETKVTVDVKVSGQGGTLLDLAKSAYGKFDVNGTPGVLRALGKKGEVVGTAAKIIGLVGALRGSDTTMAAAELASELNEMRFDRFLLRAERGADLNLKLTSIEFASPTMRLTGNGSLANKAGVPIDQQPMQVLLQLAGKDHMAVLLNKAGLLNGEKDPQGYYLMSRSFELGGTPAKPDSSQLWKIVGEAGLKAGAGLLFR